MLVVARARVPLAAVAVRCRLARAVHPGVLASLALGVALRLRRAVRRVIRARRILRRRGRGQSPTSAIRLRPTLLPLRDPTFAVLFFVSVGMLFRSATPRTTAVGAGVVVLIIVARSRSIAAVATPLLAFRHPFNTALTVADSRADRRVLVHPGRHGAVAQTLPPEGQHPHPGQTLVRWRSTALLFAAVEPLRDPRALGIRRRLDLSDDPLAALLPTTVDQAQSCISTWCWSATAASARVSGEVTAPSYRMRFVRRRAGTASSIEQLRARGIQAVGGRPPHEPVVLIQAPPRALAHCAGDRRPARFRAHKMVERSCARRRPDIDTVVHCVDRRADLLHRREREPACLATARTRQAGYLASIHDRTDQLSTLS